MDIPPAPVDDTDAKEDKDGGAYETRRRRARVSVFPCGVYPAVRHPHLRVFGLLEQQMHRLTREQR